MFVFVCASGEKITSVCECRGGIEIVNCIRFLQDEYPHTGGVDADVAQTAQRGVCKCRASNGFPSIPWKGEKTLSTFFAHPQKAVGTDPEAVRLYVSTGRSVCAGVDTFFGFNFLSQYFDKKQLTFNFLHECKG